jgi:hypothetical protein
MTNDTRSLVQKINNLMNYEIIYNCDVIILFSDFNVIGFYWLVFKYFQRVIVKINSQQNIV